jgi:hypothetical protein
MHKWISIKKKHQRLIPRQYKNIIDPDKSPHGDVMVSIVDSDVIDRGFDPQSSQFFKGMLTSAYVSYDNFMILILFANISSTSQYFAKMDRNERC